LHKPLDLRVEKASIPQIGSYEVLVKMKRVGICGSDEHYYLEGSVASYIVKKPLILGHECAGEIAKIGNKVKNLKIGQRVVIEPVSHVENANIVEREGTTYAARSNFMVLHLTMELLLNMSLRLNRMFTLCQTKCRTKRVL
jgi:threonine dehydrogenase-like Zn-dependent dehydrogenase